MQSLGGVLVILATGVVLTQGLFAPDQQLVYHYHAIIRSATLTPAHAVSEWELQGKLLIEAHQNVSTLQLKKLTVSMYNGKSESPPHARVFHPIPKDANELMHPFQVLYDNGRAVKLHVAPDEKLWSLNIKRGIASILQLDESKFQTRAFITEENSLYGQCRTEYTITEENGKTIVRKFTDVSAATCKGYPRRTWSNVPPFICTKRPQSVTSTAGRLYKLVPTEDGNFQLESVHSVSGINVQPFQSLGELQYAFVNQSLSLDSSSNAVKSLSMPDNSVPVGLTFELPTDDLTQGRAVNDKKFYLKLIDQNLEKLSDSLEVNPIKREPHELHNEIITHVLYFLSLVDRSNLEQYYDALAIGTSYRQETVRNLFLKLLPQVGSNDSILFIRDLVVNSKVRDKTAIELLTVLPFYMRQPTEELLKECEALLHLGEDVEQDVKRSAILTFSIIIYKTCSVSCRPDTLETYVRKFVDLFTSSTTYDEQLLYIEVLNNIELGNVYDYIEPIIRGNVTVLTEEPHHIRFLGVWATMSAAYNPYKAQQIYQTYWPILNNKTEHLEMRVAALTMLMLSGPTHGNFLNLLWFMQSEQNAHLNHFYYTTLESLIETKYPCYVELGKLASHIIRYVRQPSTHNWATGNYILDYSDPKYGFGGIAQLFAVANQRTGNPNVFHLLLYSHALGYSLRQVELYLKLEGVGDAVKQLLPKVNPESLKIPHLVTVLQQLNVPLVTSEPVHIEIIAKVEGRVIWCQYINETTFYKLAEAITKLSSISREFHINYQSIKAPLLMELTQPTDLGTPLLVRLDSSILTSIRGNFTKDASISPFTRKNQVDLRYSMNAGGSVITYNPILNLWHVVRRSHSHLNYLPLTQRITYLPNEGQIRLSINQPSDATVGIVTHTETSVITRGIDSARKLKQYCSSCQTRVTVTAKNKIFHSLLNESFTDVGSNIQVSIFDCEHSHSSANFVKLIRGILSEDNKNHRILPASRPLLGVIHVLDVLSLVPPHGSCGLRAQLTSTNNEDTEIEGIVQLQREGPAIESSVGSKHSLRLSFFHKAIATKTILREWNVITVYEESHDNTKMKFKLKVAQASKNKSNQKVCLDVETTFPRSNDGVLLPWDPSGDVRVKANLLWGSSDTNRCPKDGSEINVAVRGEVTEEQKALSTETEGWPHGTCLHDSRNVLMWGQGYTPITEACYQASFTMATLRKYSATIRYKNIPKSVLTAGRRVLALLELLQPGISSDISNSTLEASLEVPVSQPNVKLVLNRQQLSLGHDTSWLEPLLINTRFASNFQLAMKLGLISSCVVNLGQIISLDNATNSFTPSTCYTLVAADCTNQSKFAIFVKKVPEQDQLAIKVYVGGNSIEIYPVEDKILQVSINGQDLAPDVQDYVHPPGEKNHDFKVNKVEDGIVRVTSEVSGIWVQHNGRFLVLVLKLWYRGQVCGLCGDFNGDASNDFPEVFTILC